MIKICRNPGLNQGPLYLQFNALPTELLQLLVYSWINNFFVSKINRYFCNGKLFRDYTFPYLQSQYILKIEKSILYTKNWRSKRNLISHASRSWFSKLSWTSDLGISTNMLLIFSYSPPLYQLSYRRIAAWWVRQPEDTYNLDVFLFFL